MELVEQKKRSLLVTLLAYNEEKTVEKATLHVYEALREEEADRDFEILIVDDGSSDNTGKIAELISEKYYPYIRVIHHRKNLGPGSGILTGLSYCMKDIFTFFAGDFQGNFKERIPYLRYLDEDVHVVIGYRTNYPHTTLWRKINSKLFVNLMKLLFQLPYKEYNFFYFFRREVWDKELELLSRGIFVCPELLIRAKEKGLKIIEVPGSTRYRIAGKSQVGSPKNVLFTAYEMLRFFYAYKIKNRLRI